VDERPLVAVQVADDDLAGARGVGDGLRRDEAREEANIGRPLRARRLRSAPMSFFPPQV
jgi:hypothetical protein